MIEPGLIAARGFANPAAAGGAQSSVTAGRVAVKGQWMGEFIVGCRLAPFPGRDAGEALRFPCSREKRRGYAIRQGGPAG